jgi:catechol 2,3-dioxygenase-like lactoylglutathione lyase family enzyme
MPSTLDVAVMMFLDQVEGTTFVSQTKRSKINMTVTQSETTTGQLPWREVHHLALATRDLDATVRFYSEVLGMHAEEVQPPNPIHGRTCTIKPGANATVELHFFEQADAQPLQPPPDMLKLMFPRVGVHHIAFGLPDTAAAQRLLERLQVLVIVTTPIMDQGETYNLLFHDNNELMLEANWPKT